MKIVRFTLLVIFVLLASGMSLAQNEPQILLTLYGYGPENNYLVQLTPEGYSPVTRGGSEMDISVDRYLAYTISDGSPITSIDIIDLKTWLPYSGFDSSFETIKINLNQALGRGSDLAFWNPKWSPDGQHLAFYVQNTAMDHPVIAIASRSSGYILTLEKVRLLGWKTEQNLLVMDELGGQYDVGSLHISGRPWRFLGNLSFDFYAELELTSGTDSQVDAFNGAVLISNRNDGVLTVRSDTHAHLEVLVTEGTHAVWSPDGSKFAYIQHGKIWIADADGTNPSLVDDHSLGPENDLQWFGNRIYFKLQTASFADGRVLISLASIRQDGTDFKTHFELPDRFWDLDFVVY